MRTPKYSRVVLRIAEREGMSLHAAAWLYQRAVRAGVKDFSKGLPLRIVAKIDERDTSDAGFLRWWETIKREFGRRSRFNSEARAAWLAWQEAAKRAGRAT